ncbi:MAG TPA: phosphoribosyltransferase family protein, partial [Chitinophagaceae bacterium]|nr:phosphoribosyltransferase family protein [Chitinophagaceae bacterium]
MHNKRNILSKEVAEQKLQRIALEVAEQLSGDDAPLILIGIRKSGTVIAEKIGALLRPHIQVPMQIIFVSFDKQMPKEIELTETPDFTDKNILLVDDVTNSGKTL